MIDASDLVSEKWQPDFSESGQSSPVCTRWLVGEHIICNLAERVEWREPRVQVLVCETCGYPRCASGGHVAIRRCGSTVLWLRCNVDGSDAFEKNEFAPPPYLQQHGAVAIPDGVWAKLRGASVSIPKADDINHVSRMELIDAWLLEMPPRLRLSMGVDAGKSAVDVVASCIKTVAFAKESLLACESGDTARAMASLDKVLAWVSSEPDTGVNGDLVRIDGEPFASEALYLDCGSKIRWPALATVHGSVGLGFGADFALTPALV